MKTFILGVLVFTLIAVLGEGISADSETSGLATEASDFAGLQDGQSGVDDVERSKRAANGKAKFQVLLKQVLAAKDAAPTQIQEFAKAVLTAIKKLVAVASSAATPSASLSRFLSCTWNTPHSCCELVVALQCNLDMYELKELAIVARNIFISLNTYNSRVIAAAINSQISAGVFVLPGVVNKVTKRGAHDKYAAKNDEYDEIPGEETTEVEHLAADLANAARVLLLQAFGKTVCLDEITFLINSFREAELWYLASAIIRIAENKPGLVRTWVATVLIKALKANCLPVIRKWESAKHYTGTPAYGQYGIPPVSQYNAEVPELIRKAFGDKCNPQMLGYLPTIQVAEIYVEIKNSDKEGCPAGGYEESHPPEPYHPPPTSYTPPKEYDAPDYPTSDYHPPTPEYAPNKPDPYKKNTPYKPAPEYQPPKQEYNKKTPEYTPPKKKVPYTQPSYKTPEKYTPPPTYEYTPPETPEYPAEYPSEPQTYENPYPEADPYTEPSYTEPPSYPAETSYPEDPSYSAGYPEEHAEYPPYGSDME